VIVQYEVGSVSKLLFNTCDTWQDEIEQIIKEVGSTKHRSCLRIFIKINLKSIYVVSLNYKLLIVV
jgi:hypothetical protein